MLSRRRKVRHMDLGRKPDQPMQDNAGISRRTHSLTQVHREGARCKHIQVFPHVRTGMLYNLSNGCKGTIYKLKHSAPQGLPDLPGVKAAPKAASEQPGL